MEYKRFILFCFDNYYRAGGFLDAEASFDTLEECLGYHDAMQYKPLHYQIFDCFSRTIVLQNV